MIYPSLAERLKNQHTTIQPIIAGLGDEKLNHHPEPGKWSIHDNIVHLATYQPVYFGRMKQILSEDSPLFGRYKADDEEDFLAWQGKPLNEVLAKIEAEREEIIQFILGLNDEQLNRRGVHAKYGNLTILEWTEFFLLHEAHHLFTIFQLAHVLVV